MAPEYPLIEWGGGCNLCGHEPWNEGDDHDPGCEGGQMEAEIVRLRHIVRVAADFYDQIHPDVEWDRVPPWTMDVVRRLARLLAAFDEEEDERNG